MSDEDEEMDIVDPKAAKKQVSPAPPASWNFMPRDAPIENLKINMLLKFLRSYQPISSDATLTPLVFR